MKASIRKRLLASTLLVSTIVAASPAFAQDTPPADPQVPAPTTQTSPQTQAEDNTDIVVTGSLFRRTDTETPSPVTVLSSETLERANITTVNDAIRSVSADSAGSISTGFRNGFSAGGAAVSLRGLGVSSTVVLVDGLRSANFPLNDDGHNSYVDLNSIPFSIVDRVEVLKDGASSTYGADAIGGVVNIITKRHITGLEGSVQGGTTEKGDGSHYRATLTAGFGDYDTQGFNVYLNGEYTYDGFITNHSRGYPFNTLDLTPSGLTDRNRNDDSLTTSNPQAVVTRVSQADLNNPLSGQVGNPTGVYQLLNPASCPFGTFTLAAGTGCRHNIADEYNIIQPKQQRYSATARASLRVSDTIEAYATGSYTNSQVTITGAPSNIRQTQPFGGSAALASSSPGIVLPYFVCSAGTNCATAADRRLNPNNPFATNAAATPADAAANAARIYYLFGDIPAGSYRKNEAIRATAGLSGTFGDDYNFRVEGVYARNDFEVTQRGFLNIQGLLRAINTGAYNFVNPQLNSQAVRDQISPNRTTPSYSTLAAIDVSIAKSLFALPGGDLQVAIGGQIRRETLNNRNQNPTLDTYNLNTSSAVGRRTIKAAFFEIQAPVLDSLEINASGRYDSYSDGFSNFSPKVGAKFTPIRQLALRATYARGFRAPTIPENSPNASYAGFAPFTPPASFVTAHGGSSNPYATTYNIGTGSTGNPNLDPEKSRSFTAGAIFQPTSWLSFTVDYYNIKKSGLIVSGPLRARAIDAYYSAANSIAGCAALAAVGAGYSCNVVDGPDPLFPNALPRLLVLNAPFVNANYQLADGIDYQATANVPLGDGIKFTSRIEVSQTLRLNLVTPDNVVQRYAGTLGPYELSSGGGTPRIRGNWQNTLQVDNFSITSTTYYTGRIKQVAADEIAPVNGQINLSCANSLVPVPTGTPKTFQCYVRPFMYTDLNVGYEVNENFRFFLNVQNLLNARAPLAAGAYTSNPNYLVSWHYPGLVGRNFSAGASFRF